MAGGDRKRGDGRLIAELAAGRSVEDAASAAGVSPRTAFRRLADPAFRRQVDEAKAQMIDRALSVLTNLATAAAATLGSLLRAKSEHVRYLASRGVLEMAVTLREHVDLETRIAAIEEAQAVEHAA